MRRTMIAFIICVLAVAGGWARMALIPEVELIATSDLIILATVLQDIREDTENGRAMLRIDRVLKGAEGEQVVARHSMPPILPPGVEIVDHPGFTLEPGQQRVFFLTRAQQDYTIPAHLQGVREAGAVEELALAIAAFPYTVTLAPAPQPLYFERTTPLTVTIANRGDVAVIVHHPWLQGLHYSPRFGTTAYFILEPGTGQMDPVTVEPRSEKTFTVNYAAAIQPAWFLLSPDTYLLTPVMMRMQILIEPKGAEPVAGRRPGAQVASTWQDVLIGYPPTR